VLRPAGPIQSQKARKGKPFLVTTRKWRLVTSAVKAKSSSTAAFRVLQTKTVYVPMGSKSGHRSTAAAPLLHRLRSRRTVCPIKRRFARSRANRSNAATWRLEPATISQLADPGCAKRAQCSSASGFEVGVVEHLTPAPARRRSEIYMYFDLPEANDASFTIGVNMTNCGNCGRQRRGRHQPRALVHPNGTGTSKYAFLGHGR